MTQRNRDTEIWAKQWHRTLSPAGKCFWTYLLDNCDAAGVWDVDWGLAEFQIGCTLDKEEILEAMNEQISVLSEKKILVRDFVRFQCRELSPDSRFHVVVFRLIQKHGLEENEVYKGLLDRVSNGSLDPCLTPKSKSKGKGRAKGKGKEEAKAEAKASAREPQSSPPLKVNQLEGFTRFWEAFGDKRGKAQAAASWHNLKPDGETAESIISGAFRYAKEREKILDRNGTPKMAQGWLTDRRWEDESTPESQTRPGEFQAPTVTPTPAGLGDEKLPF